MYDLYGNVLLGNPGEVFFPCRLESKNRYSGLLYDKLKCLLSYIYYDNEYLPNMGKDHYFYVTLRFYQTRMNFNKYKLTDSETSTINIAGQPLTVVTNRTFNFIDN